MQLLEAKFLALAVPSEPAANMLQKSFPQIAEKLIALKAAKVETLE